MKKILIIQNINEAGPKLLTDHPDYEFEIVEDINDPSLKEKIVDCDGASLRTAKLSGEIINLGKKLKIISRHGVGYNNIDLEFSFIGTGIAKIHKLKDDKLNINNNFKSRKFSIKNLFRKTFQSLGIGNKK